jgi:hypothetical protein
MVGVYIYIYGQSLLQINTFVWFSNGGPAVALCCSREGRVGGTRTCDDEEQQEHGRLRRNLPRPHGCC